MTTSQAIVDRIIELCNLKEDEWTVNMLSTKAAMRQSTVNDIVTGKTENPGIITIKKICDGLEISLKEFFNTEIFDALEPEIK